MRDEIIRALEEAGALVVPMSAKTGFDLVVVTPKDNYLLRLGAHPLNALEHWAKCMVEQAGGAYYLVDTPEQALDLVRGDWAAAKTIIENGARHELFDSKIHRRLPGGRVTRTLPA